MVSLKLEKLSAMNVVLASGSPRRRELLHMIVPNFTVAESRYVDESYPTDMPAVDVPVYLSQIKAAAYSDIITDSMVLLTADTVVISDNKILGKPTDAAEAKQMLTTLSNREHKVVTGVTLRTTKKTVSFAESTVVKFAPLTEEQIDYYISNYKPFDKAGAYGIQEWIGAIGIEGINGDFYNVMGLPLHSLYKHLNTL